MVAVRADKSELPKVRYRGLAKNKAQLQTLFALVNLSLARRRVAAAA
jgi:IS5 family transposase